MSRTEPPAEVLIIGAGAAGGVAARRLAEAGVDVVCLEQGTWPDRASFRGGEPEGDLVSRQRWSSSPNIRGLPTDYPVDVARADLAPVNYNGVGGGTVLYNAQWPRLLPADFRVASTDGVADDWPLTYAELQPFYERIDQQFTVSGLGGNPAYPPGADPPLPPLPIGEGGLRVARAHARLGWHWWPENQAIASVDVDSSRHRCVQRGSCGQGCGEGAKASTDLTHWPAAIAAGAHLITEARVREITVGPDGRATGATWVDPDGREHVQGADVVLVAANGIGTPRLLLNSTSPSFPDGLANSSGLVGRRLMLHPLAAVVGLFDDDLESWRGQSGALIQSLQFYASDPARGFCRGARWSLSPGGGVLKAAFAQGGVWGEGHHGHVRERLGRTVSWTILGEDLPELDNRVELSPSLADSSGMPAPAIHYRVSDNSTALLAWHAERARESLLAAGAVRTELIRHPANGHFLGTARMGDDPARSVVDRWGMAHDVPNLGILDGSTFVTAGGVNPTSTICALSLRTVEHLLAHRGRPPRDRPRRSTVMAPARATPVRVGAEPVDVADVDRVRLATVADLLIPAGPAMPSASQVHVHGALLDRVLRARPDLAAPLRRALDLLDEAGADRVEAIGTLAGRDAEAHAALLLVVTSGYYMDSAVRRRLDYPDDVSRPVNALTFPRYVDEGLLDDVGPGDPGASESPVPTRAP